MLEGNVDNKTFELGHDEVVFTSDKSQHGPFVDAAEPLFFIDPDRTVKRARVLHLTAAGLDLEHAVL